MNVLGYRPYILFLIWIRNKNVLFLLNHKLNRKLYYRKLIIALTTTKNGNNRNGAFIVWKVNGKVHRNEGPAIISDITTENPNGTEHSYYQHGKCHRDGGPARIYGISNKYPNGIYHSYYQYGEGVDSL